MERKAVFFPLAKKCTHDDVWRASSTRTGKEKNPPCPGRSAGSPLQPFDNRVKKNPSSEPRVVRTHSDEKDCAWRKSTSNFSRPLSFYSTTPCISGANLSSNWTSMNGLAMVNNALITLHGPSWRRRGPSVQTAARFTGRLLRPFRRFSDDCSTANLGALRLLTKKPSFSLNLSSFASPSQEEFSQHFCPLYVWYPHKMSSTRACQGLEPLRMTIFFPPVLLFKDVHVSAVASIKILLNAWVRPRDVKCYRCRQLIAKTLFTCLSQTFV